MKIGLLGCGVVGSGVVSIVDALPKHEAEIVRILVKEETDIKEERMTCDYQLIVNDPEIDTVVECMGGLEPAHTYLKQALKQQKNVVTSNKKMLATYKEELFALAAENGVSLRYEACVGGGIPWIENLQRIRRIDAITSVQGIVNGTTNYILSTMQNEQADFDVVLKKAQELGYAERDPSDDIDGYDARYKVILSSMCAFDVTSALEEIPCFGIRYIKQTDMAWAKAHHCHIKLIASASYVDGKYQAMVMPAAIRQDDYIANVNQNLNAVMCASPTLGPAAFIGQGAGSLPTAHAVVQDVLSIHDAASIKCKLVENAFDTIVGTFYIRTTNMDAFAPLSYELLDNWAILVKAQKLTDVLRCIANAEDESLFIMRVEK